MILSKLTRRYALDLSERIQMASEGMGEILALFPGVQHRSRTLTRRSMFLHEINPGGLVGGRACLRSYRQMKVLIIIKANCGDV